MRVLLTGGSGNLGQTLVPRLLEKGDTPVILDVRAPPDLKNAQRGVQSEGGAGGGPRGPDDRRVRREIADLGVVEIESVG